MCFTYHSRVLFKKYSMYNLVIYKYFKPFIQYVYILFHRKNNCIIMGHIQLTVSGLQVFRMENFILLTIYY